MKKLLFWQKIYLLANNLGFILKSIIGLIYEFIDILILSITIIRDMKAFLDFHFAEF